MFCEDRYIDDKEHINIEINTVPVHDRQLVKIPRQQVKIPRLLVKIFRH